MMVADNPMVGAMAGMLGNASVMATMGRIERINGESFLNADDELSGLIGGRVLIQANGARSRTWPRISNRSISTRWPIWAADAATPQNENAPAVSDRGVVRLSDGAQFSRARPRRWRRRSGCWRRRRPSGLR
jgi:hypothetical protein